MLAVAGGIVSEPETFNYFLQNYHTVWLRADPEEHMARVRGQGDERPMTGNSDAMEELRSILTSREALYAKADVQVDTSYATQAESFAAVIKAMERKISYRILPTLIIKVETSTNNEPVDSSLMKTVLYSVAPIKITVQQTY